MRQTKPNKRTLGLYEKFVVKRTDGTHRKGRKHHECQYFVLDVDHDPFAVEALRAYARACESEYPMLALDLLALAAKAEDRHSGGER